jgi:hypothetical protein
MIALSGVRRTALPVRVTRPLTAAVTAAGQSTVLCLNPARIVVLIYEIAAAPHCASTNIRLSVTRMS